MKIIGYRRLTAAALFSLVLSACSSGSGGAKAPGAPGPQKPAADESRRAPDSVLEIKDGSPASADRVTMMKAIARADAENKKILLDVSAAWCGPCQAFAMDFDGHPEYLKELTDDGYIVMKGEFEKIVSGGGHDFLTLNDYTPAIVNFFPSFFLYSNGKWTSLGAAGSYAQLKSTIADARQPLSYSEVLALAVSQEKMSDAQSTRFYASLIGNYQSRYSYAEAKTLIATLKASNEASRQSVANFMRAFVSIYAGIGAVPVAEFAKDFPEEAAAMTDASNQSFSARSFNYALLMARRESGLKKTVEQCGSIWQNYRSQIRPGTLSAADFQRKLADLDLTANVTCAHLEWESTGVTPELKAKVAALDKSKIKDWALLGAVGEVDAAVAVYHERYQTYVKFYDESRPALEKDLDDAKAGGDQAKIEEARQRLELEDFRGKYHAKVDADVEGDLRCGVVESALTVLN
jgi:hypothetical protein